MRIASASEPALRRYISNRPRSLLTLSGRVAVFTPSVALPLEATSPNGRPTTPKRSLPGVNTMPSMASLTMPEK